MDLEKDILQSAQNAISASIIESLTKYNSPLNELCSQVINDNSESLYELINDEFTGLLNGNGFKKSLKEALNKKLASTLIQKMGGELEKRVNELRQNPETRAKITLSISKIIEDM